MGVLPADRRAPDGWGDRAILLYGGIMERPLTTSLNGKPLGRARPESGPGAALAFCVPERALKWGGQNTVLLRAEGKDTMIYGPVTIGPREALEWKPLAIRVVPCANDRRACASDTLPRCLPRDRMKRCGRMAARGRWAWGSPTN